MFYRALAVGIVAFWVWMTVLLVRVELFPEKNELLPVPLDYLWKLVFLHEQPSDLVLYSRRQRLGTLHVQPRRLAASENDGKPMQVLTAVGGFALDLPGLPRGQRVVLKATLDLDERQELQVIDVTMAFYEPRQQRPVQTLTVNGRPPREEWRYQVRAGDVVIREDSGTSAIFLAALNLPSLGIDPHSIEQMGRQQARAASITARRGSLHVNGEDIETYVVAIRHNEGLESTIQLNQLGQILAVKTFAGFELYDEAITP